jgi:hypothetical protein
LCQKVKKKIVKKLAKKKKKLSKNYQKVANSSSKAFGISFADRPKAKRPLAVCGII